MLLTLLVTLVVLLVLRIAWEFFIRDRNLPPGPRRLPLIGNLHVAPHPDALPWHTYEQWRQRYGPIFSVQMGGSTLIFVASASIAHDLLDKRATRYSDRPRMVQCGENLQKGNHILLRQYDDALRRHQRMEAPVLSPRAADMYAPVFELETCQMLWDMMQQAGGDGETGANFVPHLERYTISSIYSLTYGLRVPEHECRDVRDVQRVQENLNRSLTPGAWIVDVLPWLNYLPERWAPWKRTAEEAFQLESEMHLRHMDEALERRGWNWTKEFVASKPGKGMDRLEMAYDLGHLADAGFDTQSQTLQVFIMACITQPAFLVPAHQELESVVGKSRLPTLADRPRLPFVHAVVKEVLRWRTVVPINFPHTTMVEDHYMGYRIPAGSAVLALQWSMNMDSAKFPNPHDFEPKRWLELENHEEKQKYHAFGYGRRICTGRHVADQSLFLTISRLLWAFDIVPTSRETEIDINHGFTSGFLTKPKPFKATFKVRNEHTQKTIEKEWVGLEKDVTILLERINVRRQVMKT